MSHRQWLQSRPGEPGLKFLFSRDTHWGEIKMVTLPQPNLAHRIVTGTGEKAKE